MLFFNSIIFHFFLVHCLLHFAIDARSFDSYFSTFFSELHCLSNLLHTAAVTSIKCSKTALCSPPLNMMIPFVRHAVRWVFFGVHPAGWQNWSELKNGKMWHGRSNDSYIMWQVTSAYLWAVVSVCCFTKLNFTCDSSYTSIKFKAELFQAMRIGFMLEWLLFLESLTRDEEKNPVKQDTMPHEWTNNVQQCSYSKRENGHGKQ